MLFKSKSKTKWDQFIFQKIPKLFSVSEQDHFFHDFLKSLVDLTESEGAVFLVHDPLNSQYTVREQVGEPPLKFCISDQHPVFPFFLSSHKQIARKEFHGKFGLSHAQAEILGLMVDLNSEVLFPLFVEEKIVGIIGLGTSLKSYSEEERKRLETIVHFAEIFLKNSTLQEKVSQQSSKIGEFSKLKGEFLHNVTHELNTPLHGILGLTELLLEDPEHCLNSEYKHYLELVKKSGESLLEKIDHLLLLTGYQSGLKNLVVKKVSLKKITQELFCKFQEELNKKQIVCSFHGIEEETEVYGNEQELKIVFQDLIGNAIKFTEKGSIQVHAEKAGQMVKVSVRDTGIGIDPQLISYVFDEFRQAEEGMNRSYEGTGIGLSVVKKIVELHGGRVWVESKRNEGSSFFFTLPLSPGFVQVRRKDLLDPLPNSMLAV